MTDTKERVNKLQSGKGRKENKKRIMNNKDDGIRSKHKQHQHDRNRTSGVT